MSCKQHTEKKVACPTCKAAAGQNCLMAPGTFGRYHQERITASRGNSYITGDVAPEEIQGRYDPYRARKRSMRILN